MASSRRQNTNIHTDQVQCLSRLRLLAKFPQKTRGEIKETKDTRMEKLSMWLGLQGMEPRGHMGLGNKGAEGAIVGS